MRISTVAIKCISLAAIFLTPDFSWAGWVIDFNKKKPQLAPVQQAEISAQSGSSENEKSLFEKIFVPGQPTQDIVIINTEQGFIPATVRVKEGAQYRLVVVNVNEKARNVSFVLDAFTEHHSTFYGQVKSFYIHPKKEGVYTFTSPETAAKGRLVVHPGASNSPSVLDTTIRAPASE